MLGENFVDILTMSESNKIERLSGFLPLKPDTILSNSNSKIDRVSCQFLEIRDL